jgi:hypothetical protein
MVREVPDLLELASAYCRSDDMEIEAIFKLNNSTEFRNLLEKANVAGQTGTQRLDISAQNQRVTISTDQAIRTYISANRIDDMSKIIVAVKKLVSRFYDPKGQFAVNLKVERVIRSDARILFESKSPPSVKHYRIIRRWSVEAPGGLCRIDMSVVRNAASSAARISAIPREAFTETYEVEVEYIGNKEIGPEFISSAIEQGIAQVQGWLVEIDATTAEAETEHLDNSVAQEYYVLTSSLPGRPLIGPNPVTLCRVNLLEPDVDIISVRSGYMVTEKADGTRASLFIASDGRPYVAERSGSGHIKFKVLGGGIYPELASSFLDGELIGDHFLAFDIYYSSGLSVAESMLPDRISEMARFKDVDGLSIKKYRPAKEACNLLDEVDMGVYAHNVDGLIYMPIDLPVGARHTNDAVKLSGAWDRVFKWKPVEQNSIDFLVDVDVDRGIAYLYLDWSPDGQRIQPLEFYAGRSVRNKQGNNRRLFEPIPTTPLTFDIDRNAFTCENGDRIESGSVVEFSFVKQKFRPMRVRQDKQKGNFYDAAMNVWSSIQMPVTRQHVCLTEPIPEDKTVLLDQRYWMREKGGNQVMVAMRSFHYWVKAKLFESSGKSPGKKLLDLACGQGGDLSRWQSAGFSQVMGIDLYDDSITNGKNGVLSRIGSSEAYPGYLFAKYDASIPMDFKHFEEMSDEDAEWKSVMLAAYGLPGGADVGSLRNSIATKGFDVVACMFALHYFFETSEKFTGFIDNVVENLKPGGYFVGCCFDAEKVEEILLYEGGGQAGRRKVIGKNADGRIMWLIEASDEIDGNGGPFGKKIEVYVGSINRKTAEFLVDFDVLEETLGAKGIELVETGLFSELYNNYESPTNKHNDFDNVQKKFSFLNRYFVFKMKA